MRLTKKAQVTLFGLCVFGLILSGTGYAQAKSTQAAYEEQSKQIELYKNELNDMQGQLQEYTKYKAMYECMAVEKDQLQKQVDELSKWKALGQFTITYYWPGEDKYGNLTSTGVIAQEGKTIAVDPEIIPYGSIIKINGNEYLAEDCGGAIKGNRIDIFVENPTIKKYNVEVYIRRNNYE